jgi:hypothetical protein
MEEVSDFCYKPEEATPWDPTTVGEAAQASRRGIKFRESNFINRCSLAGHPRVLSHLISGISKESSNPLLPKAVPGSRQSYHISRKLSMDLRKNRFNTYEVIYD